MPCIEVDAPTSRREGAMTCSCQQRARQETMDAAARAATRRCRQTGFQLRCTVARTWRIVPRSRVLTVICLLPPWGAIPAPPARQVVDKSVTLCQLKRSLVSAFALQIAGCILSSWTSGRNRRDLLRGPSHPFATVAACCRELFRPWASYGCKSCKGSWARLCPHTTPSITTLS